MAEIDALLDPEADFLGTPIARSEGYLFAEVFGGLGYTDNVFLESKAIGAAYTKLSADVFGTFESDRYGSFQVFLIYEEAFYEDVELYGRDYSIPSELSLFADLEWAFYLSDFELTVGGGYSRAEYFFEPFSSDFASSAFLKEKRPIAKVSISTEISRDIESSVRFSFEAPRYDGTSEDYDVYRLDFSMIWQRSSWDTVRFRLAYAYEDYVDAPERLPSILSISGTSLEISRFWTELRWTHKFAEKGRARFRLPLRFEVRNDSGGGYYDRWQAGIYPELRWSSLGLDFELRGTFDYIDYKERTVSSVDTDKRWQLRTNAELEISKQLGWARLWVIGRSGDLDSNADTIVYDVRTVETGISMEF